MQNYLVTDAGLYDTLHCISPPAAPKKYSTLLLKIAGTTSLATDEDFVISLRQIADIVITYETPVLRTSGSNVFAAKIAGTTRSGPR